MGALYIGIIMLCRILQHMSNKKTSNMIESTTVFVQYSAFRQLLSASFGVILILIAGNGFYGDTKTIIISAFSGVALVISMYCSILALKSGTMALTSMFATAGLLVPVVAGIFLFGIPMKSTQWIGIVLFFIGSYFLMGSSKKVNSNFSIKTVFLLIGVMLSNGCTMLAQQMFTYYVPKGDVSVFSFMSFGILGVALLIALPFVSRKTGDKVQPMSKPMLIYGIILSVCVFIINQTATLATAFVPPVILFTFINGGSTIIAAIIAAAVFKEKLTTKSVFGILLGVTSLIIIKMF